MSNIQPFFYKFFKNVAAIFSGFNFIWQILAILITYAFVTIGFDWLYFEHTRSPIFFVLSVPAIILGFVVPILVPIVLLAIGFSRHDDKVLNAGYALAQAGAIAYGISIAYKAITGRVHPVLFGSGDNMSINISRDFHFGFLQGGVVWGWPSGHTIVAFALAATAITLCPTQKMKMIALLYAFYIGVAMSVSLHWLSDAISGAIIGAVIGIAVGSGFKTRLRQ